MPNDEISPIGEIVKKVRKQQGWSQEEFAGLSGIAVRTIQRIEAGERANIDTVRGIAATFNLDTSALLPLNAPMPRHEFAALEAKIRQQASQIEKEINVLPQIQNGKELLSAAAAFDVLKTDYPPPRTPEEGGVIAAVLETVRDYGDMHGELDPRTEIEVVVELDRQLAELSSFGLTVFAGKLRGSVAIPALSDDTEPLRLRHGGVFICRSTDVKMFDDPNAGGRPSARFRIPFGPIRLS